MVQMRQKEFKIKNLLDNKWKANLPKHLKFSIGTKKFLNIE